MQGNHVIMTLMSSSKRSLFKMRFVHPKKESRHFQIPRRLRNSFESSVFATGISARQTVRVTAGIKLHCFNFSGVVCTGH